jgi:8-oxo-dGTP pyrophosphatase MutT (NUDIX family)
LSFSGLQNLFEQIRSQQGFPNWQPELLQDRRKPIKPVTRETATRASVLIALAGQTAPSVVFTTRHADLPSHAGQISFPGGRWEDGDHSLESTALREAHEEIGLHPRTVQVWGRLPEYFTATGYLVTPVIGRIAEPAAFVKDEREVADIFEAPLAFLMDPANHQLRCVPAEQSPTGEPIRFYAMSYRSSRDQDREFFIWGATAAMLRNLYHLLAAAWQQGSGSRARPFR